MDNNTEFFSVDSEYGELIFSRPNPDWPEKYWPPLKTETIVYKKGDVAKEGGYHPLVCDLVIEKDTPITTRDGRVFYADIFHPAVEGEYPVIIVWSPYGKIEPPNSYDVYDNRAFMNRAWSCGLDTFEGPEPDYWVSNGYIIANVDIPGSTNSEGPLRYLGRSAGQDTYDAIEWFAAQEWCNGKVTMIGNSWLAAAQWYAAGTQPPHLACIAPWEGFSEHYWDKFMWGCIPTIEFHMTIMKMLRYGEGYEMMPVMLEKHPWYDDYWKEEKRPAFDKITAPAYVVASWTSNVHPYGTMRGWCLMQSKEKWLRVHNTQEWTDSQRPIYRDDLKKFFDHYMKGIDNGWEKTPKVRISLIDQTGVDEVNRPVADFPVPHTEYRKYYLKADGTLSLDKPEKEETVSFDVGENNDGLTEFRLLLGEDMDLCGYFQSHLYLSTDKGHDMDSFQYFTKEDSIGVPNYPIVLGVDFHGAESRLRISRRKVSNSALWDYQYNPDGEELIEPGEICRIDTVTWPLGMKWREGETLVYTVSAGNRRTTEFKTLAQPPTVNENGSRHTIHIGGSHASYIEVPVI